MRWTSSRQRGCWARTRGPVYARCGAGLRRSSYRRRTNWRGCRHASTAVRIPIMVGSCSRVGHGTGCGCWKVLRDGIRVWHRLVPIATRHQHKPSARRTGVDAVMQHRVRRHVEPRRLRCWGGRRWVPCWRGSSWAHGHTHGRWGWMRVGKWMTGGCARVDGRKMRWRGGRTRRRSLRAATAGWWLTRLHDACTGRVASTLEYHSKPRAPLHSAACIGASEHKLCRPAPGSGVTAQPSCASCCTENAA